MNNKNVTAESDIIFYEHELGIDSLIDLYSDLK